MKNNGIEDILIDNNYNSNKKNGKKGIIIIFILLLIILGGLYFAYWYFTRPVTTAKELFFNHLSNTNIKNVLETATYQEVLNKIKTQDSEVSGEMSFSSNIANENLGDLDTSKFTLDLNNTNNVEDKKTYTEFGINYSGNEVLKIKMLTNPKEFAIASDEIVNKYVGFRYDSLKNENTNNFDETQDIDLTEDEKNEFIKKYFQKVYDNIPEEKFSKQDNYVLDGSESTNVVAYSLTLNQDELKSLIKTVLTELKNDDLLLEKILEEPKKSLETEDEKIENQENQENTEENSAIENQDIDNSGELQNQEENIEEATEENHDFKSNATVNLDPVSSKDIIGESEENQNQEISEKLGVLLLGKKANISIDDFKLYIDDLIKKVDSLEGKGLVFNVFASELGTEKINIVLPNESSFDIEFKKISNENNTVKITYLYKGDNNIFENLNKKSDNIYTQENPFTVNEENLNKDSSKNSGYSLEINRVKQDASNNMKITFSVIDSEEINKKISLETKLEGTSSSKNLKSDNIITISTEDGESKIILDADIKLKEVGRIEDLTQDNTVFLEDLSEEEYNITVKAIMDKILQVYNEKKEKFNFIDTNIGSSVIQQNLNSDAKKSAKEALEKRIEELRIEAEENGEEFSLQNLIDLQIDGYEVSSTVNEENAAVVIDIYTFNIDKDFNITEE